MVQYAIWKNGLAGMLIGITVLLARIIGRKNIRAKIYRIIILFVISSSVGLGISACGMKIPSVSDSMAQTTMPTSTPGSTEFDSTDKITPTAINRATPDIKETMIVDNSIVAKKCFEGISTLGEDENISGSIVLQVHVSTSGIFYNLILFDTEAREITEITPEYMNNTTNTLFLYDTAVSPDGGMLAYQTSYFDGEKLHPNKIIIINAENEEITEVENPDSTMAFEWLNNDYLLIATVQEKNPIILTEISSGNQKYMYPILGSGFDISDFIRYWFFYGNHKNIYNSDLSRVVYPAQENGLPMIIVRDMEINTDILTIPTIKRYGSAPVWSLDGNYFAVAISVDQDYSEEYINIFNRDGEIVFQTDQSTTDMQETIYSMAWSSDSELLAFVYGLDELSGYTYHLGLLDVEEEKITLYCSPEVYQYTQLYWSPDNQYLLYPSQSADSDELSSYVLNIETGQNTLVMDGYFPGGWMK